LRPELRIAMVARCSRRTTRELPDDCMFEKPLAVSSLVPGPGTLSPRDLRLSGASRASSWHGRKHPYGPGDRAPAPSGCFPTYQARLDADNPVRRVSTLPPRFSAMSAGGDIDVGITACRRRSRRTSSQVGREDDPREPARGRRARRIIFPDATTRARARSDRQLRARNPSTAAANGAARAPRWFPGPCPQKGFTVRDEDDHIPGVPGRRISLTGLPTRTSSSGPHVPAQAGGSFSAAR